MLVHYTPLLKRRMKSFKYWEIQDLGATFALQNPIF
jgi:hypothetical protein